MESIVNGGFGIYLFILILFIIVLALTSPGRWLLAEVWNDLIKPILIRFSPRVVHWLYESHLIVIKNLLPRSVVIKTLKAKYQSKNRK